MFFQQENRSIVREKKRAKYRMVFNLDQLDWYSIYIVVSFWNDLHYAYGFMWEKKRRISLNLETFLFADKVKPRTNYVCPSGKMQHCIYQQIAWLLNEYHRNIAVEEILFEIVCRHSFDLLFFVRLRSILFLSIRFASLHFALLLLENVITSNLSVGFSFWFTFIDIDDIRLVVDELIYYIL